MTQTILAGFDIIRKGNSKDVVIMKKKHLWDS